MQSTFSQTGGARLGRLNVSWPFARLLGTPDALRLICLGRDYRFPRGSIRSLSRQRGVLSAGICIVHTDSSYPEVVVFWASLFFWTSGFRRLKAQLESFGYKVQD